MNQTSAPQSAELVAATPSFAMLRTLGLVAGLSGLLVVLTYQITLPLIEENKRIAIERALFKVIPGATSRRDFVATAQGIVAADDRAAEGTLVYAGYDEQDRLVGVALEAAAQGYQDIIRILYSFDPVCQCIRGIEVLKMAETPGIGDKIAKDPVFQENFVELDARLKADGSGLANDILMVKHGTKSEPWQIDAISGATISSRAVARMLNDSAQQMVPKIITYLDRLRDPGREKE
ncbi:MAG: FMN-binding protein [Thiogranum sp.]